MAPRQRPRSERAHTPRQGGHAGGTRAAGRSLWTGAIGFGLLQIPVTVHTASERTDIAFHQLDRRDMARVGYARVNKKTGEKVAWDDVVKGYELEKGRFVVLTDDDFDRARREQTETIEIQEFVDLAAIHPAFYETPYYLAPTKRSTKAYAILREALRKKKKAAVAKFVLRQREHLCAVFPEGNALLLEVLRFPHEIRSTRALPLPAKGEGTAKVLPKEMEMAERLVDGMTTTWDPSRYRDEYRDVLLAAIEEKARTGRIRKVEAPKRSGAVAGNVVDLVGLLKKSLARRRAEEPGDGAGQSPTARRRVRQKGTPKRARRRGATGEAA